MTCWDEKLLFSTTSLRLYWSVERLNWRTEKRLLIDLIKNGKMSTNIRQSDFRDCTPISSPSKKAKKVSQEIAPPERASSSDNEVEDSLVGCC